MAVWLTILKYTGLVLAAGSSIWALVNELSRAVPGEGKVLTSAGKVAIAITVVALLVSIVSEDLQRRRAVAEQAKQVKAEARRTNSIIIASQPLARLSLRWDVISGNAVLANHMREGQRAIEENANDTQGGVPPVWYDAMEYEASLLPLMRFIAHIGHTIRGAQGSKEEADVALDEEEANTEDGEAKDDGSIVVLVTLDDAQNTVLSFGDIKGEKQWSHKDETSLLSAGFAPVDRNARSGKSSPGVQALFAERRDEPSRYIVTWDLDPVTLTNATDRGSASVHAMASLPRVLRIAILYDFRDLPFSQNNFGAPYTPELWKDSETTLRTIDMADITASMTVELEANGLTDFRRRYILKSVHRKELFTDETEREDVFDTHCTVLRFEAQGD